MENKNELRMFIILFCLGMLLINRLIALRIELTKNVCMYQSTIRDGNKYIYKYLSLKYK